jgi:two-component system response regulator HydG
MTDEERQLRQALAESKGSRVKTAKLLGVSRMTLWRRMRKYGIEPQWIAA